MSNRLSTSQPVTIGTELIPFVDNFWLEANGQTEQWYYDNTGEYAPDRSIIPLIITPNIKVADTDTQISYTPNFYTVEWYVQQWNGTAWVRTKVTNTTDTPANPFVIVGNTLKVNKNVESPQYGITIDCEATYIDPRDAGVTYPVRDSLTLTVNKDATVPYPKIQVLAESAQSFNPLKDSSAYDFKAKADWKGVSGDNGSQLYKADALGTEEIVQRTGTLPTTTPIIGNLRYGRGTGSTLKENQSFMFRQTSGGTVNPMPDSIAGIEKLKGNTVVWKQGVTLAKVNTALTYNTNATEVVTNNGEITVKTIGTASAAYERGFIIKNFNSVGNIVGHKYLIVCFSKTATQFTFEFDSALMGTTKAFVMKNYVANAWCKMTAITTANSTQNNFIMRVEQQPEVGSYIYFKNVQLFDLTLMFGSGNEPSTVEEFEAMFPGPYYAYDAGRLLSFNPAGLKTVGFNLWDEEWRVGYYSDINGRFTAGGVNLATKNPIKVMPNSNYYFYKAQGAKGHVIFYYDSNMNFIGASDAISSNHVFTTPSNANYINFYLWSEDTYSNNICINLSDASKNGTYEPYWENTRPINITTLKGRANGSTTDVVMFHDGLKSAGSVYDEIDLKNGRAVKRIGKVDLGMLNYARVETPVSGVYRITASFAGHPQPKYVNADSHVNLICPKYTEDTANYIWAGEASDKSVSIVSMAWLRDDSIVASDIVNGHISKLEGVMVYYELATPIEYTFEPIPQGQFVWYGVSNGVEVKIDTLPAYVSGQGTDTLRVDALYDEIMTVICRYKKYPWDEELIPQKEYRMVAWRVPNIDTIVVCKNGSSVNSASTGSYTFETIVNVKGEMISDQVKAANLRFRWKMRKSNTTTETDLGWGLTKSIPVSDLKNTVVNGNPVSTIVYCEVYLLGAYEPVTTNGVTTYERNIDLS